MMTPSTPHLSADAWERRYQEGTTRWDLGQPAPPFVSLLTSAAAPAPGKVVVLGAGRGHDARLFADYGFEVTAVDFAPSAVKAMAQQAKAETVTLDALQRDIFDLVPEFQDHFDYVVEHTCFCALDPAQRGSYVELVARLLKPGGELLALFFTHNRPGGPPYGSRPEEIRRLFEPYFVVESLVNTADSIPSRRGEEHLGRLRLR